MEEVLVNSYFRTLVTLVTTGCAWWAAATVLCMGIIKVTLDSSPKEGELLYYKGILIIIGLFFISLIVYGIFCAMYVQQLKICVLPLISIELIQKGSVPKIFDYSMYFYYICTTTFLFFFISWIYVLAIKSRLRK
jgi:hypothetical protein